MELLPLNLPTRHNDKLRRLVARIDQDVELHTMWQCANINAVGRTGITDHGEVHIKIVTNIAISSLRLLLEAGVPMGVVRDHELTADEAEVVVCLAACLHDLGISGPPQQPRAVQPLPGRPKGPRAA